MRTYFRSLTDVMASPLAAAAKTFSRDTGQSRVFKSTKLEDMVYQDLRRGDTGLDTLESTCGKKLSTFPSLSRDIYQSFYSLNVRRNDAGTLSETAKRFNAPILDEVMRGEDYPAIKAACEGRQLPAYEAAGEFVSQVAENLDSLMEQAGGEKKALDTLEKLEQRRDESMEKLKQLLEQVAQSGGNAELERQVLATANRAQSQVNQADAVGRMVRDNTVKNKDGIAALVAQAGKAAAQKAESTAAAIAAWGYGPDNGDPEKMEADRNLVERVCRNKTLMEAAPWCKAVALALLDIAMQGNRRFAMIHFAGVGHFQTDLFLPGQYNREDVFRAIETFLNGNTDYSTPLQEALRLMGQEGFENADMVFITDGACALPEKFLTQLKEQQAQRNFHITGVLLDQNATGFSFSLEPFCTEILRTSQLTQENIAQRLLEQRV